MRRVGLRINVIPPCFSSLPLLATCLLPLFATCHYLPHATTCHLPLATLRGHHHGVRLPDDSDESLPHPRPARYDGDDERLEAAPAVQARRTQPERQAGTVKRIDNGSRANRQETSVAGGKSQKSFADFFSFFFSAVTLIVYREFSIS